MRGAVSIGGLAALASVGTAMTPATATAGEGRELRGLRNASCPVKYEVVDELEYGPARQAKALRWKFKVADHYVRIRPPADWTRDPFRSKAFRSKYVTLGYLDVLFSIYRDDERYNRKTRLRALRQARALALDFVRQNPLRGARRIDSKTWDNKVAGDRVGYLAYLTRAATCAGKLDRRRARTLLDSLEVHGRHIARGTVHRPSNHGLFTDLGLALLADYVPFLSRASGWGHLAERRFKRTLFKRVHPGEGVWLEHSTGYQFLVLHAVERFVQAVDPHGRALPQALEAMRLAGAAFVMPDGTIPQFGDTEMKAAPKFARRRAKDGSSESLLRYVGSGNATVEGTLERLPHYLQEIGRDIEGLTMFRRSGFAFVKDFGSGSFLAITAGFHNLSHKQADELSFDLYEDGARIVSDSGLYNKDDNRYRAFGRSSRAHSTVTVDGKSFPLSHRLVYGSGIDAAGQGGSGWFAVLGHNPLAQRQGARHERLFLYKPDVALVVVDRLSSRGRHRYERHFQLGPDVSVQPSADALSLGAGTLSGELYDDPSRTTSKRTAVRGRKRPLAGYVFPRYRTKVPRWTVTYADRARDALYATTLGLDRSQPVRATIPPGGDGRTVRLTSNGRTVSTLSVARSGTRLTVSESRLP